ncbi:hypothetical protein N7528_000293 [Penicillium herquei]|nr:hypothetical protein N7528_000293 [Penicillium herquei]
MASTSPPPKPICQPYNPERRRLIVPSRFTREVKKSSSHETNSEFIQRVHIVAEMNALRNIFENIKIYDSKATTQEERTKYRDCLLSSFDEHFDALDYSIQKAMEGYEKRLAEAGNSEPVNTKTEPANCAKPCLAGWDTWNYKRIDSLEAKIAEKDLEISRLKMKARYNSAHRYQCIHLPANHCESIRYMKVPLHIYQDAYGSNVSHGYRLTDLETKVSELCGLKKRVKDLEHEIGRLGDNQIDEKKEPDRKTKVSWVEVVENQKAKKVKCRLRRWLHI